MLKTQISSEYQKRRELLLQKYPNGLFVLPSNRNFIRNDDVHYPFRQDSNLFYMTGFPEAQSCAVITAGENGPKFVLFVQERDKLMEMWEGERYGLERAKEIFGADECYSIETLEEKLPHFLQDSKKVYHRLGLYPEQDLLLRRALEALRKKMGRTGLGYAPIFDAKQAIGELRIVKSEAEIATLKQAASISARAHRTVMEMCAPGMSEREIEAIFEFEVKMGGCQGTGYGSIVAGGANATCLHYTDNSESLNAGDLLLIDAGGEYNMYSADITRTFPVGSEFSPEQAAIYKIVLQAQKEAIELMRPGKTRADLYEKTCEVIVEGLLELGVLKGKVKDLIDKGAHKQFYPHSWGHYLGLDVHDSGLYVDDEMNHRPFEAGMVMTIEPGIYFQASENDYPESYKGIGVRIEDDILVGKDGPEVLTHEAPKEIDELLALRSKSETE